MPHKEKEIIWPTHEQLQNFAKVVLPGIRALGIDLYKTPEDIVGTLEELQQCLSKYGSTYCETGRLYVELESLFDEGASLNENLYRVNFGFKFEG